MLLRLKKTPATTTAAATVMAISSITATRGLSPIEGRFLMLMDAKEP
ncbi:hypothetical protein HRbin01_01947 [archaeon HR01]|nr:hypothetical protein HRbin01_01947 [archaeon HR01]